MSYITNVSVDVAFDSLRIQTSVYSEIQSMNIELPKGLQESSEDLSKIIEGAETCILNFCYNNEIQPQEIFLMRYFFQVKSAIYSKISEIFPEYFV